MNKKSWVVLRRIYTLLIAILVLCFSVCTVFAQQISYEIKEIGMTLKVPDNMNVITVDTAEDDLVFSTLGLDYKETMKNFAEGNIYFQAVDTKSFLTFTVTMTTTDESKKADNYNSLSDAELNQVREGFLNNSAYKSCEVKKYNNCTYLCLMMKTKTDGKVVVSQQYNTVVSGHNYVFSMQAPNGKKLKADDKVLLDSIMQSVEIREETFFNLYGTTFLIVMVCVLSFAGVVVLFILLYRYFANPVRKNKSLIHQLAHEHKMTETTQIPRKNIHQYMLQNAPEETDFMEKYTPLGDSDEEIQSDSRFQQVATPYGKAVKNDEAEVLHQTEEFNGGTDYFADIPDEREMFVYTDIEKAVDDYRVAKKADERRKRREQEEQNKENYALKFLKILGRGIINLLQMIFAAICYLAIHIKYFSINLYRLIKRKTIERKRRKIQEEKRLRAEERRRQQREAEIRRRRENENRGENQLVKVRSRSEGRTYPRSGYSRDYSRKRRR